MQWPRTWPSLTTELTVPLQDSTVRYSSRINLDTACPMDFHRFPVDSQLCEVNFESFGHTTQQLDFAWKKNGSDINPNITLAQFELSVSLQDSYATDYYDLSYPGVIMKLYLSRQIGYHVVQTYIPSIVFVVLAWLSLFISPESVPGKTCSGHRPTSTCPCLAAFRSSGHGHDDAADPDGHVRCRPSKCAQGVVRLLPGPLDGGVHLLRVCLHSRVHGRHVSAPTAGRQGGGHEGGAVEQDSHTVCLYHIQSRLLAKFIQRVTITSFSNVEYLLEILLDRGHRLFPGGASVLTRAETANIPLSLDSTQIL